MISLIVLTLAFLTDTGWVVESEQMSSIEECLLFKHELENIIEQEQVYAGVECHTIEVEGNI